MVPRWLLWLLVIGAIIWVATDPAGFGQFLNDMASNIKIFFKNLD